jgi:hypothetical protein
MGSNHTLLDEGAENDEERLPELEERRAVQLEAEAASHRVGGAHQKGRCGGDCDHAAPQQLGEGVHELPDARHGRRAVDEKSLAANTHAMKLPFDTHGDGAHTNRPHSIINCVRTICSFWGCVEEKGKANKTSTRCKLVE